MTQEEKQLLLADLCARLPYGVIVYDYDKEETREMGLGTLHDIMFNDLECKPYLRPMSSMSEEEKGEYELLANHCIVTSIGFIHLEATPLIDWLLEHHFDFRNLIERGLAVKITEGNNPYKE